MLAKKTKNSSYYIKQIIKQRIAIGTLNLGYNQLKRCEMYFKSEMTWILKELYIDMSYCMITITKIYKILKKFYLFSKYLKKKSNIEEIL